ncbi:hypothetical protein [Blautia hydrogenotrophica]|uniref:hypothetical protein n=1 Tax=Blautia hydrogenotrophica TaxID=53443 RepID=UPI002E75AEFB|nr:hypothetical protein [Blautia hydrogenotrophica]MEE0462004.1 hypothetical protein [Blautia hydrogenotrophica]
MKREKWICTGLAVVMALVLPACAQKIEREPVTVQSAGMGLELASKDDGKSVKAANAETKTDKKETPRKTQTAKQADSGVGTVSKEGQYSLTYAKDSFTQQQDENGTVALVSKDQKARIEIGRGFYEGVIETVKDADKEEASVRGGQAQQKKSGTEENTDPSENAEFKISVQGGRTCITASFLRRRLRTGKPMRIRLTLRMESIAISRWRSTRQQFWEQRIMGRF